MSQTTPVSSEAVAAAERAHDAFDAAVEDRVITWREVIAVQWALDVAVWAASIADLARELGVNVQRGGPEGDRFGRLMNAWREYTERGMPTMPTLIPSYQDIDVSMMAAD